MAPRAVLGRGHQRPPLLYATVLILHLLAWAPSPHSAVAWRLAQDETIVTDLRVTRGASEAAAREACASMCPCRATLTAHVTTNWFAVGANLDTSGDGEFAFLCMRQDRRAAVERDGGSLFALQSIAVVVDDDGKCPATMIKLFSPREGVAVCLQTASMTSALATGSYISDLDTILPGDATSGSRPVRPIVAVKILADVDVETSGASACRQRLNTSWENAGNGYVVDDHDASKRRVLCVQRPFVPVDADTADEDRLRVLVHVTVIPSSESCGSDFQEQGIISSTWAVCSKHQDTSTATRFISHVVLATSAASTDRPLVPSLALASTVNLNNARSGLSTYLMIQDVVMASRRRLTRAASTNADTAPRSQPLGSKTPLRARVIDGNALDPKLTFKVLQIADLHLTGDPDRYCLNPPTEHAACGMQRTENLTLAFLEDLLDAEKPDLVMFSGDTITVREWELKDAALEAALNPVEARGIPYAWIMGNHDDDYVYDRQEIMDKLITRELAYVESGPSTIQGVGNYALDIKAPLAWGSANESVFRIYFLDSNKNRDATLFPNIRSRYDWIRQDQIAFYESLSQRNQEESANGPAPAIMFFHIPIPEYASLGSMLFRKGEKHEKTEGPDFNSGLLEALARRGEVKATFVGHDHTNEFCYKTKGVQLCYGGGTGFGAAIYDGLVARRARVVEWTMDTSGRRRITSWKRLFGRAFWARTHEEVLYSEI